MPLVTMMWRYSHRRESGFGLMEALVAIVVLSLGLMGMMRLQIASMRNTRSAQYRVQAAVLTANISERMRSNRDTALSGAYDTAITDPAPTSASDQKDRDLVDWKSMLSTSLPGGQGSISTTPAAGISTIRVRWDDSASSGGDSAQEWLQEVKL